MVHGKPGRRGGSHQGIYICAPSGKLLARQNTLNADKALALMERGWQAWSELPPEDRFLEDAAAVRPSHRWEFSFPAKGLVLVAFNRDLPADGSCERTLHGRGNRDHAWFNAEEAREWLPRDLGVGSRVQLPAPLVERLVRFHLVDNVRGQVGPFAREEVADSRVEIEVVAGDEASVEVVIRGHTRAESDGVWKMGENDWKNFPCPPRGVETTLLGTARFDRTTQEFSRFELVAVGESWGGLGLNGRRKNDSSRTDRYPIGFHFALYTRPGPSVAPAFVDVYDTSWIEQP